MTHAGMEGKDTTLFDAIRELEDEANKLAQHLEIVAPHKEKAVEVAQGATERKVLDAIRRLRTLKHQIASSAKLIDRFIRVLGE